MDEVVQSIFIVIVSIILVTDFIIFARCKTYLTLSSLLISVCLAVDLIARIS